MKKFFTILTVAIAVCLSMSSCLTVGGADEWGKVSKLADNGKELSWSFNGVVAKITYHFGYEGEKITYHKEDHTLGSTILARAYYEDYDKDSDIKYTLAGKTVKITYPASEYEGLTTTEVRQHYKDMEEGLNLPD